MLRARLDESGGLLLLDGGLASELEHRGHRLDHFLWSARLLTENPDAIAEVTRDFAAAGSDILATATYQASFPGFSRAGYSRDEAAALFRRAVDLTRAVADTQPHRPLVAASLGPYGAYLADGSEYRGDYGVSHDVLRAFHRERLETIADAPADILAFETFPSATEIDLVANLLEEIPEREAWVSCSCRNERELWDGTPVTDVAARVASCPTITAFGVNCVDPRHAVGLIGRIRQSAPGLAVVAYPNAGRGWDAVAGRWRGVDSPGEFATRALAWRDAGAAIIGGCCLTGPGHIRALRDVLRG